MQRVHVKANCVSTFGAGGSATLGLRLQRFLQIVFHIARTSYNAESVLRFISPILRYGTQKTKLAAFGSTRRKNSTCEQDANVKALIDSGADVITLVAKAWDVQVTRVLEASLEENLLMIKETVEYFKVRHGHAASGSCIGGL